METLNTSAPAFSPRDRTLLRDLALQVAEIGNDPIQTRKAEAWTKHNDLQRVRPMVLVFPEGAWRELLPDEVLETESDLARDLERDFRRRIYYWRHLPDDNVIEPRVDAPIVMRSTGWGLDTRQTASEQATGAYHIEPVLNDERDLEALCLPRLQVDREATEQQYAFLQDLFGDLLTVEKRGVFRGAICALDFYAKLRGIDALFLDLVDNPDFVHRAVGKIVDGHIAMMTDAQKQEALTLGNRNHYAGSGGTSYTRQLPQPGFDGVHVRSKDLWGFATSQIFSEVSPAMLEEFALQHEKRYLELFGLNCYACCEPVHDRFEQIFRNVPRLRRISISPWADVDKSAEVLQDKYVFSWKPNPAVLAGGSWDPDKVRAELRRFCERTRDNVVEMIMKDTHTVAHQPERMWEWVRIAREVAEEFAT